MAVATDYLFSICLTTWEARYRGTDTVTSMVVDERNENQAFLVGPDLRFGDRRVDIARHIVVPYEISRFLTKCFACGIRIVLTCHDRIRADAQKWVLSRLDIHKQRMLTEAEVFTVFHQIFFVSSGHDICILPPREQPMPAAEAPPLDPAIFALPLMKHQLQSLQWMIDKEKSDHTVTSMPSIQISDDIYINYTAQGVELGRRPQPVRTYHTTGFVLNNRTGYGKTANVIALCALRPTFEIPTESRLIMTKANLIIVPVNLSGQWQSEINKFAPGSKVVVINDIRKFRKVTVEQILDADFVITTVNFLKGRSYVQTCNDALGSMSTQRAITNCSQSSLLQLNLEMYTEGVRNGREGHIVLLECFRFLRIVLDEIHEIAPACHIKRITGLSACRWWGLTANDLATISHETLLMLFLRGGYDVRTPVGHQLFGQLFGRCQDVSRPAVREFVHYARASALELAAVETQYTDELKVRATTGLQSVFSADSELIRANSMDEVVQIMLRDLATAVTATEAEVSNLESFIQNLQGTTDANLQRVLASTTHKKDALQVKLQSLNSRHRFLQVSNAQQVGERCPVCMDNGGTVLFECGHSVCQVCYSALQQRSTVTTNTGRAIKCPTCRTLSSRFYQITSDATSGHGCKFEPFLKLMQSKLAAQSSIVVFVQWTSTMTVLYNFLKEHLPVLRLTGNVHSRRRCLSQFSRDEPCVLLLSLDNSSCGLNLVKADTVVFLHTMVGPQVLRSAKRRQAIARVDRIGQASEVEVHSFIMKDSTEQVMFEADHETDLRNGVIQRCE